MATINTGDALSTTVTATDDSGSVSYSKQSGAGWISVNSSTGELTGSTGTANTYSITVRAEDAAGNFVDRTFDVVVESVAAGCNNWQTGYYVNFTSGGSFGMPVANQSACQSFCETNGADCCEFNPGNGQCNSYTGSCTVEVDNFFFPKRNATEC